MIFNLKDLANALAKVSIIASNSKQVLNVLFDIRDSEVYVKYSDGNNHFMEKLEATIEDTDVKQVIAFNLTRLNSIIDSCKPTGSIITKEVNFIFNDTNNCRIRAEKKILIDDGSENGFEKIVSVIDQSITWQVADNSVRLAVLSRCNYSELIHSDEPADIEAGAISVADWEVNSDKWDRLELINLLSKLSIEKGKIVYIAPKSRLGFVQNTSSVICIPFKKELYTKNPDTGEKEEIPDNKVVHKIVLSSTLAKSVSDILSKIADDDIYVHMLNDGNTVVYSTADNSVTFAFKNNKQDNSNVNYMNNSVSKDYSKHIMYFNTEVLASCLNGAIKSSESDKVSVVFQKKPDINNGEEVFTMVIEAKNTNKSIDNVYDIIPDKVLDEEATLEVKLNVTLAMLYQAVNNITTPFTAFDIAIDSNGQKTLRIAEISIDKLNQITSNFNIELSKGGWSKEFTIEHRAETLGYTTYFTAGAD